eukprot:gb/GFBE01035019.1/.p1 GENE.gb/GFBE01035019.1/~~gb/GFBE01035019.1/.p1  ORF type:complete len:184 (+),score=28.00 gb/GFBE01035019.1/:1-552(+)
MMAPSGGWQGEEAATFVAELCDLPQYSATAQRNLSLGTLRQLKAHGLLSKGLARAGISELQHQKRIGAELRSLEAGLPDDLLDGRQTLLSTSASGQLATITARDLLGSRHTLRKGPCVPIQRGSSLVCSPKVMVGAPVPTPTSRQLLRKAASAGCLAPPNHASRERLSPSPFDMTSLIAQKPA